jgi:hypothetical protein
MIEQQQQQQGGGGGGNFVGDQRQKQMRASTDADRLFSLVQSQQSQPQHMQMQMQMQMMGHPGVPNNMSSPMGMQGSMQSGMQQSMQTGIQGYEMQKMNNQMDNQNQIPDVSVTQQGSLAIVECVCVLC